MASIYRRTRTYPIPNGAEIVTDRKGRRFAKWTDGKGRTRKEPLNADGDKVTVESGSYLIAYYDASGVRQEVNSKTTDLATAKRIEGQLENQAALRQAGIINAEQEQLASAGKMTFEQHLADFEASMVAAGRGQGHISKTVGFVRKIAEYAGFVNLSDITADGVNRYASDLTAARKSARTVQACLTAIKSFTRWLTKHGKLPRDPLASVKKPSPAADRRHERRMLLHEEWDWLRATTEQAPERYGMTGRERMLLYGLAIQTGLRSGECQSLTRGRLYLDATQPYVTVKASSTKNKKDAKQYIQPSLAAELRQHIATKAPTAPVFAMPDETRVADMFRADLADARRAWLRATDDPAERLRREQSDFLAAVNHEGEHAVFHSLRHTTGAWMAMAGVHLKTIQTVMRHSVITLTMDTYGHLFPGQDASAVASLPDIVGRDIASPDGQRATGTDGSGSKMPANRQQYSRETMQDVAGICEQKESGESGDDAQDATPNVLPYRELCGNLREDADRYDSSRSGTRTRTSLTGQRILSPLRLPFRHPAWMP